MTTAPASVFLPTLPGHYYTDPAVFELEKRNIFEKQWMYVCRAEDVPTPGRFVRTALGDETVLVVRGRDQKLRAFLNVCRHRGAQLCLTDSGDAGKAIRCPYHAWAYQLDGRLITAPNWQSMDSIDKADYSLHPVHLAEWHGLVWVSLAADPEPFEEQIWPQLDYRLGGDRDKFARYGLADLVLGKRVDYEVAANWKIIQENFQECYHCGTIHPELVETLPQFRNLTGGADATYDTDGYLFAEGKASFSVSGNAELPRIGGLEEHDDRKYYGMVMRPNCFISLLPDHVIVHRFEMLSPETTRVVCEWLFPPQTVAQDAPYDIADSVELFHRVNEQDFAASEWCQPNMKSRAYRNGGVLVPTEQEIIGRWYYRWYHEAMGLDPAGQGERS
ncbi:aromatic ring-hydroxylating dioxygenase subunit alpha [Streptomyces sp. NBC_00554]|uniref:aromatic ring-hydroxylating oxygenase subunit alpha n=1 Tax=Streptomyces sp. NBC_00554 TaxID=2903661 RepID=UPI00352E3F0A|nr:aromatic ring-hydroxylating dioxygenase subunit alpha [Streptomyces sp. NBC_00554]